MLGRRREKKKGEVEVGEDGGGGSWRKKRKKILGPEGGDGSGERRDKMETGEREEKEC